MFTLWLRINRGWMSFVRKLAEVEFFAIAINILEYVRVLFP